MIWSISSEAPTEVWFGLDINLDGKDIQDIIKKLYKRFYLH